MSETMQSIKHMETVNGSMELLSVIIPVYNVEEHLEQCVTSVLQQNYSAMEIILVNDCSTDTFWGKV